MFVVFSLPFFFLHQGEGNDFSLTNVKIRWTKGCTCVFSTHSFGAECAMVFCPPVVNCASLFYTNFEIILEWCQTKQKLWSLLSVGESFFSLFADVFFCLDFLPLSQEGYKLCCALAHDETFLTMFYKLATFLNICCCFLYIPWSKTIWQFIYIRYFEKLTGQFFYCSENTCFHCF